METTWSCRENKEVRIEAAMEVVGGEAKTMSYETGGLLIRRTVKIMVLLGALVLVPLYINNFTSLSSFQFPLPSIFTSSAQGKEAYKLEKILRNAAMRDGRERTVIITTVNEAWAANDSLLDLFLESFRIGNNTQKFLNHLVIITLDQRAYLRCISLHPHCYALQTKDDHRNFSKEAFFMTHDYLEIVWRKIGFLHSLLNMGYNFVFTDADIVWFRDPFERFYENVDFQIACDYFNGRSYDVNNWPNSGFSYVRSNHRTIEFYKFWYSSRIKYPRSHDQDVLNKIKNDPILVKKMGLKMRFLDTAYFGGFCEPSKDLNLVITMHANCCTGLHNKIHNLRIVLDVWRNFTSSTTSSPRWICPRNCSLH